MRRFAHCEQENNHNAEPSTLHEHSFGGVFRMVLVTVRSIMQQLVDPFPPFVGSSQSISCHNRLAEVAKKVNRVAVRPLEMVQFTNMASSVTRG